MWLWIVLAIPVYLVIAGVVHSLIIRFNWIYSWGEDGRLMISAFWPVVVPIVVLTNGLTKLVNVISKLMLGEHRLIDRFKSRR